VNRNMGDDYETTEITDSLKGIKVEPEGQKPQKEIVFITNEETAEVLDDIVRYNILQTLRKGIEDTLTTETVDEETGDRIIRQKVVRRDILSVMEIVELSPKCCAEAESISKNQVYHHLPKLIEHGYVIKYGTIKKGKRSTDYYRRTAKGFLLTTGAWGTEEKRIREKLDGFLDKMLETFNIKVTKGKREELLELSVKRAQMQHKWRTKIAEMVNLDIASKETLSMYEMMLDYYSVGSEEYMDTINKIREILFPEE
jgi:DNA-binding transcriptional ArsR family regulator